MAGRPKTMAKRVAALYERAEQLLDDLLATRPAQYAKDRGVAGDGSLASLWSEAADTAFDCADAFDELLCRLKQRAGIQDEESEDASEVSGSNSSSAER